MRDTELTDDFVKDFLRETERKWAKSEIDQGVSGFQIQPGTKWNPGLAHEAIGAYQAALGIEFPNDLVTFLRHANGTNRPTVNVYSNLGYPHKYALGVYCFPQHLEAIKQRIEQLADGKFLDSLELEGNILGERPQFIPFFEHRYVLSNGNLDSSIVCSIHGSDAIVYGSSLKAYLQKEFLS